MPTSTDENQPVSGTERASRDNQSIRHKNTIIKKTITGITIPFKGNLPEVGVVFRTKNEN